jgi:hypothetical protein
MGGVLLRCIGSLVDVREAEEESEEWVACVDA